MATKKASPASSTAKKSTGAEIVVAPPSRKDAVKKSAGTAKKPVVAKPAGKAAVKKSAGAEVAAAAPARKVAAKNTTATRKAVPVKKAGAEKPASAEVTKSKPRKAAKKNTVSPEVRNHMVATAAYFLAEKRGFVTGYEMEDWASAEKNIDAMLVNNYI